MGSNQGGAFGHRHGGRQEKTLPPSFRIVVAGDRGIGSGQCEGAARNADRWCFHLIPVQGLFVCWRRINCGM